LLIVRAGAGAAGGGAGDAGGSRFAAGRESRAADAPVARLLFGAGGEALVDGMPAGVGAGGSAGLAARAAREASAVSGGERGSTAALGKAEDEPAFAPPPLLGKAAEAGARVHDSAAQPPAASATASAASAARSGRRDGAAAPADCAQGASVPLDLTAAAIELGARLGA